jgi:predicted phage gp36 major capsid-like protein
MTESNLALETKHIADLAPQHESLMRTFEAYKDTNDERIGELERRGGSDVVVTDRLERISQALDRQQRTIDDLALKASRPDLSGRQNPVTPARLQGRCGAARRPGGQGAERVHRC